MYRPMILTMMLFLSACAPAPSGDAICDGTRASRVALAGALVADGGPESRRAGLMLIGQIDAGCGD